MVSLITRPYGRGTDFFCLDNVVNNEGGVVVVQTFLTETLSEEIQIQGRTARQSNPGSYYLIINCEDLAYDPW